jgi:prolyl oligopeptidase
MAALEYPAAGTDDAVVRVGRFEIADPYRWLEDDEAPEVQAWQEAQNELAVAYIRGWPQFARLRELIGTRPTDGHGEFSLYDPPVRAGGGWLRRAVPPGREGAVVELAASPAGEGRVLVDPGDANLDRFSDSPDGATDAYFTSE